MVSTKENLINVAIRLIWEHSYQSVSIDKLCKEAKANKGSFYHFFPSKRSLALASLDTLWKNSQETIFKPSFNSNLSPNMMFKLFFKKLYESQVSMQEQTGFVLGCPFGNFASELGVKDNILRRKIEKIFSAHCSYFEKPLYAAAKERKIKRRDVPLIARSILSYSEGALLCAKIQNDTEILNKLLPKTLEYVGLTKKKT